MPARFHADFSSLSLKPDVIIIGGGIAGLTSAFFLAGKGLRPLVVERLPAVAMLASRRSGEGVRAQWEKPENIAIARRSIAFYRDFTEYTGHSAGYRPLGYLYASRTEDGAEGLYQRVLRQQKAGLDDVFFLKADDLRNKFSTIAPDVTGAAFRQQDGVIDIAQVVKGLLQSADFDIATNIDVSAIKPDAGGVTVTTSHGRLDAPAVVLSSAARAPAMLSALGITLPLRLSRSTIQYVEVEGVPSDHAAVMDVDLGSFWRPDSGGARMTASFQSTLLLDTFTDDPPVDPDYLGIAIKTVAPMIPMWNDLARSITGGHVRSGSLLVSADGGPLIGPVAGLDGVYLNTAYGGHGLMASPEGSRQLAAMIADGADAAGDFLPSRFGNDKTKLVAEPMTVNLLSDQG